jgi:hypothetical protein
MNELCYLVGFTRSMPGGEYVASLSVPANFVGEVRDFFDALKEKGMFTKMDYLESDWFLLAPMRTENYDFDTGRWEYDWSNPPAMKFESAGRQPSAPVKFDYVDMMIVNELQKDANYSMKDIADALDVNYKKLAWHYTTHVMARQMLQGFSVNWMGTKYDSKIEKVLHRQHRIFALQFVVKDVNEFELISLRHASNKVPFLWSESIGKNYMAEFAFPLDFVVEGIQWLTGVMEPVRDRATLYTIDQGQSASFTIPYTLYEKTQKKWIFQSAEILQRFDNLMVQIRSGSG